MFLGEICKRSLKTQCFLTLSSAVNTNFCEVHGFLPHLNLPDYIPFLSHYTCKSRHHSMFLGEICKRSLKTQCFLTLSSAVNTNFCEVHGFLPHLNLPDYIPFLSHYTCKSRHHSMFLGEICKRSLKTQCFLTLSSAVNTNFCEVHGFLLHLNLPDYIPFLSHYTCKSRHHSMFLGEICKRSLKTQCFLTLSSAVNTNFCEVHGFLPHLNLPDYIPFLSHYTCKSRHNSMFLGEICKRSLKTQCFLTLSSAVNTNFCEVHGFLLHLNLPDYIPFLSHYTCKSRHHSMFLGEICKRSLKTQCFLTLSSAVNTNFCEVHGFLPHLNLPDYIPFLSHYTCKSRHHSMFLGEICKRSLKTQCFLTLSSAVNTNFCEVHGFLLHLNLPDYIPFLSHYTCKSRHHSMFLGEICKRSVKAQCLLILSPAINTNFRAVHNSLRPLVHTMRFVSSDAFVALC